MTFSEFAHILHSFVGGSIKEFTTNLLLGGLTSRLNYIEDLHSSTLRNYYNGDRQLTYLWSNLYDVWDKQEFIRYVETTYKAESFAKISKRFSDLGFAITPDCVPKRLAEIFLSIMDELPKDAVQKKSKSPEKKASRMLEHDREKIAGIIGDLADALQHVQDPLHDYLLIWNYMSTQEQAEYEQGIDSHILNIMEYCKKLEFYAKRYPDFSELKKLMMLGKEIYKRYYAVKEREALAEYEAYRQELHKTLEQVSAK